MIKQLGTLGFFIKFNESASAALKFIEIFSSSAATTSLFSASTSSAGVVSMSAPATMYVNGLTSASLTGNYWNHLSFTFNPKLYTDSNNTFIIRFGNMSNGDFNIQNVYMLDYFLDSNQIYGIHNGFTGIGVSISASATTSSMSIIVSDKNEAVNTSSYTGMIYQPIPQQLRFKADVSAVVDTTLTPYVSTTKMVGDRLYQDGIKIDDGDYVISLYDNKLYQLSGSTGLLVEVSISNGDYFNVMSGIEYGNRYFVKTSSGIIETDLIQKIEFMSTEYE